MLSDTFFKDRVFVFCKLMVMNMMRDEIEDDDEQTRVLCELCSMILNILRSPPLPNPLAFFTSSSVYSPSSRTASSHFSSPASFASLFLGISIALMLFGSVTFVIGFILMPWVIGLVVLFYFAGVVSNLSDLGRSILSPWASSSRKDYLPAWKFL